MARNMFTAGLDALVGRRDAITARNEDTRRFDLDADLRRRMQMLNERIQGYNETSGNRDFNFRSQVQQPENVRQFNAGTDLTREGYEVQRRGQDIGRELGMADLAFQDRMSSQTDPLNTQILRDILLNDVASNTQGPNAMPLEDAIEMTLDTFLMDADQATRENWRNVIMRRYGGMVGAGADAGGEGGGLMEALGRLLGGFGGGVSSAGAMRGTTNPLSAMTPGMGMVNPVTVPPAYNGQAPSLTPMEQPSGREEVGPVSMGGAVSPATMQGLRTSALSPGYRRNRRRGLLEFV